MCTLQDLFSTPEIRRIIGTVGELPSLSSTHISLKQAMGNPNTGISQVADILGQDMAMSAKVLHMVNSAFFGLAQKVTSLHAAASYLGMETIKNLSSGLRDFPGFCAGILYHAPWFAEKACTAVPRSFSGTLSAAKGLLT